MPNINVGEAPSRPLLVDLAGKALRLLLVAGLVLLSPGLPQTLAHAQPAVHALDTFETARERLDTVMTAVEGLRQEIDRSLFDADELAFELAFEDADTIAGWVEQNIAYQPYRGLLRGPDGVLMTGAGNSLDQAALLARLLSDAGYSVRIGLAELSEQQAHSLLLRASSPNLDVDSKALLERSEAQLDELTELPGVDTQAFREQLEAFLAPPAVDPELVEEANSTGGQLAELVESSEVALGTAPINERLLAEAREYAWVEYRFSADEEWSQVHPLMVDAFEAPETERYLEGAVPADLQHRLRVEVLIERKLGDSLETVPVMKAWERPVANAWGTVISYSNAPSGIEPGEEGDIASVLAESDFFVPQLHGSMAPGAQAFDLQGVLLEPSVAQDQAAGVFRQVNENLQSAAGALGALGGSSDGGDPQALTAQWIDYTLIGPGGEERTYRRTVFDRIGQEQRSQGVVTPTALSEEQAQLALISEQRIMAFPGGPRPEYLLDRFLGRFLEARPFLEYMIARLHDVEPEATVERSLAAASPLEHLLTVQLFDAAPADSDVLSYRAEPTVLVYSDGLRGSPEEPLRYSSIDIVHNARRMLRLEGESFSPAITAAIEQGVWETIVEREVLAAQGQVWNTTTTLAAAVASGSELIVVSPGSDAAALGLPAEAAVNLQRDLDRGYAAVLPRSFPADERAAWWRISPATGETLGMTADGRGQSLLEYTIQLYDMGFTVMFAVKSLNDCEDSHGGDAFAHACCLAKAHVNNVAGLGLGSALGKAVGGGLAGNKMGLLFTLTTGVTGLDVTFQEC